MKNKLIKIFLLTILLVVSFYACGSGPGGDEGSYNSVLLSAPGPAIYQSHATETKKDGDNCVPSGVLPDSIEVMISSTAISSNPSPVKLTKYDIEFIPRNTTNTLVAYNNTKTLSAIVPAEGTLKVNIIPLNEYEKSRVGLPAASEEYDLKITFYGNEINYNEDETFTFRLLYTYMVPACSG
jgi:hypothetical protein